VLFHNSSSNIDTNLMWLLADFAPRGARAGPAPGACGLALNTPKRRARIGARHGSASDFPKLTQRRHPTLFRCERPVGRSQFWYFMLANVVFAFLAAILQSVTFLPLLAFYSLAMILPSSGMGARRLQDIGRDGRLIWVFVVAGFISQLTSAAAIMSSLLLGSLSLIFFGPW